jgi:hypothetical protein
MNASAKVMDQPVSTGFPLLEAEEWTSSLGHALHGGFKAIF